MRKLTLSKASSRWERTCEVGTATWDQLVKKLTTFQVADDKDVGWWVGGPFDPAIRRKAHLKFRSCLGLDIDHLEAWELDLIEEAYAGYAYVCHSTFSHTKEKPRLRLFFPLARDVKPEEYEPIARWLAARLGMDYFDDTTYQVSRVMYWPSRKEGAPTFHLVGEGEWFDPDVILGSYEDWTDWGSWPRSSREESLRPPADKAEDPYTKPGIIGAFNRVYVDFEHLVDTFDLPYTPSGTAENRYTFTGGTGVDGCIWYPDDGHLHSWHESDPARGNHNAWDVVRLHKFGSLDKDYDGPIGQSPSQKAMVAHASDIDEVVSENATALGFEDLGPDDGSGTAAKRLDYDSLVEELGRLHDDNLGGLKPKMVSRFITRIAAAKLEPALEAILLRHLKAVSRDSVPVAALEKQLQVTRRKLLGQYQKDDGSTGDIEKAIVREALAEHFQDGRTIRRVAACYWTYEHGLWARDSQERVAAQLQETLFRLREERPEALEDLVAAVGESRTTSLVRPLSDMMARILAKEAERDDPLNLQRRYYLPVINTLSNEIHMEADGSFEVLPHNPDNFFTNQVEVAYNPGARTPKEWMRFCKMIFQECKDPADMQRHLEEVCGYIIQQSRWLRTWVLFHGPTGTGKTTVGDVLKSILGRAALESDVRSLDVTRDKFALQGLIGKLMVMDDDMTKGALLPDGILKKLSEEKPLWTDIKYGEGVNFISRAVPVLLSNHWPHTRDLSDALRDRALVFPFNYQITREERSDDRKVRMLEREREGIFKRFVDGLARLRARGDFDIPVDCRVAKEEWVKHSNPLHRFIEECLVLDDATPHVKCQKRNDIYAGYTTWAFSNVDRRYRLTKGAFFDAMEQLGFDMRGPSARAGDGAYRVAGVKKVQLDLED